MKICTKCGEGKQETEFYFHSRWAKHVAECKKCCIARGKARFFAKREQILAQGNVYARAKRKRIREATFAAYGGNICVCCGEGERTFLTLDHINNDGAKVRKSIYKKGNGNTAGYHTYQWLARNGFPPGYQVLCMNCNYGKRMNNGVCPHEAKRNDHPQAGVESSDSKRIALLKLVSG